MDDMTTISIRLPTSTAKAAEDIGLLTTQALDRLLTAAIEEDEAGHMVSIVTKRSGNTLFASTKGGSRHTARIKIAVDSPDSLNEADDGKASMARHDFSTVGAYMPLRLVEQVKKFIELNRAVLLEYWDAKIDTESMLERRKPVPGKR
jgi:hypothetical protein